MVKNQELVDLVRKVKYETGLTQNDIAKKIGISKSYLSDTVNGRFPFSDELRGKLYETFPGLVGKTYEPSRTDSATKGIPLIPQSAMAGPFDGNDSKWMPYDCEMYRIPAFDALKADFIIRVDGDSMEPTYMPGDLVACKKVPLNDIWFQWGKAYVIGTVQGALVKRLRKSDRDDCVKVVSDNSAYEPFDLPIAEIHTLALAIGLVRVG